MLRPLPQLMLKLSMLAPSQSVEGCTKRVRQHLSLKLPQPQQSSELSRRPRAVWEMSPKSSSRQPLLQRKLLVA